MNPLPPEIYRFALDQTADVVMITDAASLIRYVNPAFTRVTGYPAGRKGGQIPPAARITAVADVFDVLVHERPYKDSWSVEDAAAEIRKGVGTQFDPDVVQAFEDLGPAAWEMEVQRA